MRTTHFAPSIALALLVMASHATLAQDETAPAKGEAVVVVQGEAAVVQDEMARQRLTPADTSSFRATLHLRLVMLPTFVTIIAIRAGIRDARDGHPAFLWGLIALPAQRKARLLSARSHISRIFIVACVLDTIYQVAFLRAFYPIQVLIVAIGCAILSYVLISGPTTRIVRCCSVGSGPSQPSGPKRSEGERSDD